MTDRNVLGRFPQITLDKLARSIARPLKRPRRQKPRADLPDIVVKNRPPARIAQFGGHLPQPLRLHPRIRLKLPADSVLKRIELRPGRRPRILRRLHGRQRPPDRLAMQPRPPADLPNRDPLDPVRPPDLCLLLHADHPSSSPIDNDPTRVRTRPDDPDPAPGGSLLDRRRWVTISRRPQR